MTPIKYQLSSMELYNVLKHAHEIGPYLDHEAQRFDWDLLAYEVGDDCYGCYVIHDPTNTIISQWEHFSLIEAIARAILDAEIKLYTEREERGTTVGA